MSTYRRSKGLIGALKLSMGLLLAAAFSIIMLVYVIPVFALYSVVNLNLTAVPPATSVYSVHIGDSILASAQWNDTPNMSWIRYQNATGAWINQSIPIPYTENWTNATIVITNGLVWNLGDHGVIIYANDTTSALNSTSSLNFTVWGWSEISEIRDALTDEELTSSTLNQSQSELIYCKVRDNVTNQPLSNYTVSFFRGGGLMNTNLTDSYGHAYFNLSSPFTDDSGTYTISCSITDNPTIYYNDSVRNYKSYALIVNDSRPPFYDNQGPDDGSVVGIGQGITLYARWTENVILGHATLWTNETGAWTAKTGIYNSPLSMTGYSQYLSSFNWMNASFKTQNVTIRWAISANDSSGNVNITDNKTFIIRDLTAPSWSNQNQNVTNVHNGDVINMSVTWSDNSMLDWSWLSTNETGAWVNYTSGPVDRSPTNITGYGVGPAMVNFTWQNASLTAKAVSWRVYANDTANNINVTPPMTFYTYGWANLTNASGLSSDYIRSSIVPVTCLVRDVNLSSGISGYPVRFWKDNVLQFINYTNTSGHAVWNWNTTLDSIGNHTIRCDITESSTLFYNTISDVYWNESTNITGSLKAVSLIRSQTSIYRNNAYSPYTTGFIVGIQDELGNNIENANVSFWNSTNTPPLLTSCLTNSAGLCIGDWNANDTITPDNYTIAYNASKQFYLTTTNTTWMVVKGVLDVNITSLSEGDRVYKTKNITFSSAIKDEYNSTVAPDYVNWTLNSSLMSGIACLTANCDNATWYIKGNFSPLGQYYVNAIANKTYYETSSQTRNIQVWGWSTINNSDNPMNISINTPVTLKCSVVDNATNSMIPSYLVKFYSNSTGILDSTITAPSGWANLTYLGWSVAGTHNITCNITDDSFKYYSTASQSLNSTILKVYGNLSIVATSEAPFTISPGSNGVGMLRLNISAYGENINVTSFAVHMNGTASSGNVTAIALWNDSSGNPSSPIPGTTISNPTFPAVLAPTGGINVSGSRIVHIVINISNYSTSLATVGMYIPNSTNISATGMTSDLSIAPLGAPYVSSLSIFSIRFLNAPTLLAPAYDTVTKNSSVNFTWNNVSSAVNYTIRIDNDSSDYNSPQFINMSSYRNYAWTAQEGVWWWWVTATDGSRVESNPSDRWKLTVDRSPPIINLSSPLNNSNWTTAVQLIFTPYDNLSSTVNCSYILDSVTFNPSILQNGTTQFILLDIENGNHNVSLNCTDAAGNTNTSDTRYFSINTLGSVIDSITLDKEPPFYTAGENVTVTVNVTDPNGISNVTANDVNLTKISANVWRGNITAPFYESIYLINVIVTNTFGIRSSSFSYFAVDSEPPVVYSVTVKYPANKISVVRYENITINATINDPGFLASGINTTSVTARLRNVTTLQPGLEPIDENITLILIDVPTSTFSGQWNCSSLANDTTVEINVTASDNAGNLQSDTSKNFTVDNSNFSIVLAGLSGTKTSSNAMGSDYWQWVFNTTLYGGTRARMKLADWSDGNGHTIGASGNAVMIYQNSSGAWKTYNIKNDYEDNQTVDTLNDTSPGIGGIQATIILNMTIPYGTYPSTYSTSYGIGIYP